jgi:hypothetical protein
MAGFEDCVGDSMSEVMGLTEGASSGSSLCLPFRVELDLDRGKVGAGLFHLSHDDDDFGLSRIPVLATCTGDASGLPNPILEGPACASLSFSTSPSSSSLTLAVGLRGPSLATPLGLLAVRMVVLLPLRLRRPICLPPVSESSVLARTYTVSHF